MKGKKDFPPHPIADRGGQSRNDAKFQEILTAFLFDKPQRKW